MALRREERLPERKGERDSQLSLARARDAPPEVRAERATVCLPQRAGGFAVEELFGMQLDDHQDASAMREVMLREPLLEVDARRARAKLAPFRRHPSVPSSSVHVFAEVVRRSSRASATALCGRAAGSLARQRITIRSTAAGSSTPRRDDGRSGTAWSCGERMVAVVSWNSSVPVNRKYASAPTA